MRISEVLGLRIRDIDFSKGLVHVRKQSKIFKKRDKDGKVSNRENGTGTLKTEDSIRDLSISEIWRKMLEERFNELKSYNDPQLLIPDAFIFCNRKGEMRTYSGTRSSFIRFMKAIKLDGKGYTLHSFRHSFISHAIASGMDKKSVSRYVGHANSDITERIYTHLTQEQKVRIAGAIDKTFEYLNN